MSKKHKLIFSVLFLISLISAIALIWIANDGAVMDPKGMVGLKERNLLVFSTLLMLIIVIPVLIITCVFAWKYRADNKGEKYTPDWADNFTAEAIWWGLPFLIIIILSVAVWTSSHELDPFKPIVNGTKPVEIQVVALEWKWLFIYPEQKIAAVNFVQFPEKTPLNFDITGDAPMNSFWIPQLGGQIYAMNGMKTKLHLIADEKGEFRGSSANLSGRGFAGMVFMAKASSNEEFESWVSEVRSAGKPLNLNEYNRLAMPSESNPVAYYTLEDPDLFDQIVMKFMMPMP
ncbi:MAG: ubiquinol oxidase subunit II [Chlamydiae bacterium RIFCSPHIGHO2_12_FULL_49_9]|nr:MAG: ubiquinol oxidase subunit II [Chlamydiae bacterium RIFCSPHIGHO2_12_FULL_49_9]